MSPDKDENSPVRKASSQSSGKFELTEDSLAADAVGENLIEIKERKMADTFHKVRKTLTYHANRLKRVWRKTLWNISPPVTQAPIFVVGCSRAGTTLVYKTLSESKELGSMNRESHDYWAGLHPLEKRGWSTHGLSASDASAHEQAEVSRYFYAWTGRARWVDKNNQNGLCIKYLHALFPSAHFIYVKRSPGDNLHSLISGWSKPEEFATWSEQLPAEVHIENGRYRRWCFFLSEGWRDYINASIEDVAAFQYESINAAILDDKSLIPQDQWTEVFYEDLVQAPVLNFKKIFSRCGLQFDSRMDAHCRNVLDTPYNAFSEIRLNKWMDGPNREKIQRVLPRLRPIVERMGYEAGP